MIRSSKFFCKRGLIAASYVMGSTVGIGFAVAQTVDLTAADHVPAKCDVAFGVADLAHYRAPKAKRPYKIEFSLMSFANPWVQATVYGAQKAAQDAGVTLTIDAAKGFTDTAGQITQLENALTHPRDAVMINGDADGMVETIDEVVDRGIPVIDIGNLTNSKKSLKLIQDDYAGGVIAADTLAKLLPSGGQGVVLGGPANATWARRRVAGFLDTIKKYPNLKLDSVAYSDLDPQDGLTKFTNAAQAHPKLDFIYPVFSFLLPPQSIPADYRKAVYLSSGLSNVTIDTLNDGTAAAILPDFPVSVGYVGLSLLVEKLNGSAVNQYNCIPVVPVLKTDLPNPFWVQSNIIPGDWSPPK
jgi:ribose transport system substrate-binding protein